MTHNNNNNDLGTLKIKLKSAMKLKLSKEKELCQLRNKESFLNEEITVVKSENELLKEQLEEMRSQIAQTRHQIAMIGICSTSEKCKMDAHLHNLNLHLNGFSEIFKKEQETYERRMKEIKEKEAEEEEIIRLKEICIAEEKELKAKEATKVEAECEALEGECAVLRKRNYAIMLKLRRKLLETEKSRRELTKKYCKETGENS